jgi:orotate phosphoribosyltransferase
MINKEGNEMSTYTIPKVVQGDDLATLVNCEGYYACPTDDDGKPLEHLVRYRGTYDLDGGGEEHYVGFEYFNFSKADQWPTILRYFVGRGVACMREHAVLEPLFRNFNVGGARNSWVLVGMPWGAVKFSTMLGDRIGCQSVYLEKKPVRSSDTGECEDEIVNKRYDIEPGSDVVIVEELVNNLSTTGKAIDLIEKHNTNVRAILCVINRSFPLQRTFTTSSDREIPIISVIERSTPQYRQDDPLVEEAIRRGMLETNPKENWERLKAAMEKHA